MLLEVGTYLGCVFLNVIERFRVFGDDGCGDNKIASHKADKTRSKEILPDQTPRVGCSLVFSDVTA